MKESIIKLSKSVLNNCFKLKTVYNWHLQLWDRLIAISTKIIKFHFNWKNKKILFTGQTEQYFIRLRI